MKKFLFILMILFSALAFSSNNSATVSQKSYETALIERMKTLEEEAQAKLDSGITADMRNTTSSLTEAWEKELDTVYNLLLSNLSKDEKVKLQKEQNTWRKNMEMKAKDEAKEFEGGSLEPLIFESNRKSSIEKRALELGKRYDKLMEKK